MWNLHLQTAAVNLPRALSVSETGSPQAAKPK